MARSQCCASSATLQQPFGTITTQCTPGWLGRPLPDVAIPFKSDEGKRIFQEALLTNGLRGYFSLAETFHTQAEPSYCGPGTLIMG
jgi:glutathione gamma-glutamylcysteinyltransferase